MSGSIDANLNEPDVQPPRRGLWPSGGKRAFDVVAGAVLMLAVSPVLLIAALVTKITSPGPVFFTQPRGGVGGRAFTLVKLRTMNAARRPDPKELVPLDHPEITRAGRFFRRTKIDELPQLWNVVKGDMSLVGPRPTLLDQCEAYDDFRRQRLLVRPGITGLAQTNSNAQTSWEERILYDIAYVRRCSFLLDVSILVRTVMTVVLGERRTTRAFTSTGFARSVPIPAGFLPDDADG